MTTFIKPISELIRRRVSCRRFLNKPIEPGLRRQLENYLSLCRVGPFGTTCRFELVAPSTANPESLKGLGTYGIIRGKPGYIAGAMGKGAKNLEDFGYLMENIILYATGLDLGTCWLGGTFTKSRFAKRMNTTDDESVPAIAAVGYASDKKGVLNTLIRIGAGSDERLPWECLFYDRSFGEVLSQDSAGDYAEPLSLVRLTPSASNRQPWRIVRDGNMWHFFLKRTKGYRDGFVMKVGGIDDLQRIDMGIAMCHFKLSASEHRLSGDWEILNPSIPQTETLAEYVVSWVER